MGPDPGDPELEPRAAGNGPSPAAGAPDRWRTSTSAAQERLDVYLARVYRTTRSQAARWIQDGRVTVADRCAKAGLKLEGGEWISCEPRAPSQDGRVEPEPGPLELLFEDEHIVVLDKPAGLAVHPGAGRTSGTLANRLLAAYPEMGEVGGPGRPGIVHRLDLGTSGVMVAARTRDAYLLLAKAFSERRVKKTYLAVVFGTPSVEQGEIRAPIARHPQRRKEMTVLLTGRPAETGYRVLSSARGLALVELSPMTGRTHQIRVHLKHIGYPIVGDPVYGEARWKGLPKPSRSAAKNFERSALHAWKLEFRHPIAERECRFTAAIPGDITSLWLEASGSDLPPELLGA